MAGDSEAIEIGERGGEAEDTPTSSTPPVITMTNTITTTTTPMSIRPT